MRIKLIRDEWVDRPTFPWLHTRPQRLPSGYILWDMDCQGWAVGEGLHISECKETKRAILVVIGPDKYGLATGNQKGIVDHIKARVNEGDKMYTMLRDFIKQQDMMRYTDAWTPGLDKRDIHLQWYKGWYAKRRAHKNHGCVFYKRVDAMHVQARSQAALKRSHTLAAKKKMQHMPITVLTEPEVWATLKRFKFYPELTDPSSHSIYRERKKTPDYEITMIQRHEQARKRAHERYILRRDKARALKRLAQSTNN